MSNPNPKRQSSALKLLFPGYFACLKNLKAKLDEIQKYIDENSYDVTFTEDDLEDFVTAREEIEDLENDPPVFGNYWKRFTSNKFETKAAAVGDRLADYDIFIRYKVNTTRLRVRGVVENLRVEKKEPNELDKDTVEVTLFRDEDNVRKEYKIEVQKREVSRGAFGTIHIGECKELGKQFALKRPINLNEESEIIDEDTTRRFLREASIWSALDHPHILPYWGTVELGGMPHLVSPFIRDGDLLKFLARNPSSSRPSILHDIASALAYMHRQDPPVIHADIKSGNILIDSTGHTYICDFGHTKSGDAATTMKDIGTLYWLSPERLDGGESTRTTQDDVCLWDYDSGGCARASSLRHPPGQRL